MHRFKVIGSTEILDTPLTDKARVMVDGRKVSKRLAGIVILRTFNPEDAKYNPDISNALGLEHTREGIKEWSRRVRRVRLNILGNSMVCNPGGLRGWCHWNGEIRLDCRELPPYTTTRELVDELCNLAQEFPTLSLQVFVGDKSHAEGAYKAKLHFEVYLGKVVLRAPKDDYFYFSEEFIHTETECSADDLEEALASTKEHITEIELAEKTQRSLSTKTKIKVHDFKWDMAKTLKPVVETLKEGLNFLYLSVPYVGPLVFIALIIGSFLWVAAHS